MDLSLLNEHAPCTGRTTETNQAPQGEDTVPSPALPAPCTYLDTSHCTRSDVQPLICSILPAELLAEIFACLSMMERPSRPDSYLREDMPLTSFRLGWMKVTHVCRHWRAVALDYPFLWGEICYGLGRHWTMLMMERAKFATISIRQPFWTQHPTSAGEVEYIPDHISQIDELELHGHYGELRNIFENLHRKPAPRLRMLWIGCTGLKEVPSSHLLVHLPDLLFNGQAPQLKSLIVDGPCRLSFSSPWLRNLCILDLRGRRLLPPEVLPTVDGFYDLLDELPALASLSLVDYLPIYPKLHSTREKHNAPYRTVSLPALYWLNIEGDYSQCLCFVQSIAKFPPHIYLSIRCRQPRMPHTENPYRDVILEARKHVDASLETMPPITQLRIQGHSMHLDLYDETLEIRAESTKTLISQEPREKKSATFELAFDMTDDFNPHWNEAQIIETFVAEMPLSDVRSLEIDLPEQEIGPEQFFDWFSPMKDLDRLEVSQIGGIGLPLALKRTIPGPQFHASTTTAPSTMASTAASAMPIFPELTHLTIANYDLMPSFGPRFVTLVCIALERRARKGFKLPCLQFSDCFFADLDWVPRARACVEMLHLPEDLDEEPGDDFYHVFDRLYDDGDEGDIDLEEDDTAEQGREDDHEDEGGEGEDSNDDSGSDHTSSE